ncbi:MAG: lactonase family protein [Sphingobacteriales bacterium]|nr:MAG: lactonase family protein [Sphingobacteriales bacterium]
MNSLPAVALVALMSISTAISQIRAEEIPFYVGTYTKKEGSKGIYHYKLNVDSGTVVGGELAAEVANPTFLALHPNGKVLFAAIESTGGAVGAFAIKPDGSLQLLNQQPSRGGGACHVWVDSEGKNVLVANYGGGSIAALPIGPDGSLREAAGFVQHTGSSVNPQRQKEPHAHSIYTDANSRFAYVCDLGLDKVLVYKFNPDTGTLTPNDPSHANVAPGSGPRHLAFDPSGKYAYVINELSNTVTVFLRDADAGKLTEIQTLPTLPADFTGNTSTAEIFVHPNGKFVYGSNRGHDSIVVYAIDQNTGKLTLVEYVSTQGKVPRNFALDPSGRFLLAANQQTNDVFVFRVDASTGKLTPTGHSFKCGAPVSIQFVGSAK